MHRIVNKCTKNYVTVAICKRRLCSTTYVDSKVPKYPLHYWSDAKNQEKFLDTAAKRLNINELADWYKVTAKELIDFGGVTLLDKYSGSLHNLLNHIYPDFNWLPWKFEKCPQNYWDDPKNQRKFMDWAATQLKIEEMVDWYNVSQQDLASLGGNGLLNKYNNSPSALISQVYPEYEWLPWGFKRLPAGYWDDIKNQRKFMEWAAQMLNIKDINDWYKISYKDLATIGGVRLLDKYQDSPSALLASTYPEHEWLPWQFSKGPRNFWGENKNIRRFMDWAGKHLKIKEMNDWYRISTKDIIDLGGKTLLRNFNYSLIHVLSLAYPEHAWKDDDSSRNTFFKKSQSYLKTMLKTMFPQKEVLEEYRHPDIIMSSGHPLELDYYYPELKVAVEYQGQQHYKPKTKFQQTSVEEDKNRDAQKITLCKSKGITLIEVPYWWDRKYASLFATVYNQRPDLFPNEQPVVDPIPLSPPSQEKMNRIDNPVRRILMTATLWEEESMNPNGWWMTEKYDGMRLYWSGTEFRTRQGNKIKIPDSMSLQLPNVPLDGELWTQYGLHQGAVSLCMKGGTEDKWNDAVFWVFDAPGRPNKPFEDRIDYLKSLKEEGKLPDFVKIVDLVYCTGKEHLKKYFDNIIAKGGEGVILREPNSLYKAGRSDSLRKFKPFFDTEVKVLQNNYPYGFNCIQMNGKDIFIGINENHEEAKKVKEGSVITVKHSGTNVYGTLQFPKFYRERNDVKWDDLINT